MRRLRILTWHVHSSYLNVLTRTDHDWYLPVKPDRSLPGYLGRTPIDDFPPYVREVPADHVRSMDFDLILFQSPQNYLEDQFEILSEQQRRLPKIYLEHNTPRPHPVDSEHPVDDSAVLLVHVANYNQLMWDTRRTPTIVIEHSVAIDPNLRYTGTVERGFSAINEMRRRGRLIGYDLFLKMRQDVPLDLAGIDSEALGGLGDIAYSELLPLMSTYRFLLSPVRYTSIPMAVIEALTIGMPVIALATTELPMVIEHGETGFVSCNYAMLVDSAKCLLSDPEAARRVGARAREMALQRFGLERFIKDWNAAFALVTG